MTQLGRCVLIGGNGQIGRMFAGLLTTRGSVVTCIDPTQPPSSVLRKATWLPGDARRPDAAMTAAIGAADLLLVAVPEQVAAEAITAVAPLLSPGALISDTLSVKSGIAEVLERQVRGCEVLSINPMFSPVLGIAGQSVAAVPLAVGPRAAEFLDVLRAAGASVVEVTAREHDMITAVSQAATHAAVLAFGLAAGSLGVDIGVLTALAPPPHATLLAVLARIASGTPEVYWDIQHGNPMAAAARMALRDGVDRVSAAATEAEFADILAEVGDFLGPDAQARLAQQCQHLFSLMAAEGPTPAVP